MKTRTLSPALATACLLLAGCPSPAPRPATPAAPQQLPVTADNLMGTWGNDASGLAVTLDASGRFTWRQGELALEGYYSVIDGALVLAVPSGKTAYEVLSLTADEMRMKDPQGAVAYLARKPEAAEGAGPAAVPEAAPAVPVDETLLPGAWGGPYGIEMTLEQDGTFSWKQPGYAQAGVWSVRSGNVLDLTVQGNPTSYTIVSLAAAEVVITDPQGHTIPLAKAAPAAQAAPEEAKDALLVDDRGVFSVKLPAGWKKLVAPIDCTSPCLQPTVLTDKAGRRMSVILDTFVTRAGKGALGKLTPKVDALLGDYPKGKEKAADTIGKMNGFEVFSRRFKGLSADGGKAAMARLVGVHCGSLLVLGVAAVSADTSFFPSLTEVIAALLDSMDFTMQEEPGLGAAVQGTWLADAAQPGAEGTGKLLYVFYPDGKLIRARAGADFAPLEGSVTALLAGPGTENGSWSIVGRMLVLDFGAAKKGGAPEGIESFRADAGPATLSLDGAAFTKIQ